MAPEVISGRYRVKEAIGRGGMGTVWLCSDEILGRDVAVKQVGLLPDESAPDSARAMREARSAANLNHRNVVSVFDVIETDGTIWMVMEFVPSRTLAEIIRDDGALPPERVAAIGAQIADGLAAAHAAGTIHRDVKPANILVTDDGVAKIGDFGIARMAGDQALTQAGFVTGTPSYFSPELAEGHEPGPAADVWALGATLQMAVEGAPPYPPQRNPVAMLRTIAAGPPAARTRAAFLEPALARMLDRDPGSRWSMPDAAHTLHRLADRHAADRTRENTAAFPVPPPATGNAAAAAAAGTAGTDGAASAVQDRPDSTGRAAEAPPRSPAPRPGPVLPDRGAGRDGRRRRILPLVAAVAVLLLVAGLGYLLLGLGGSPAGGRDAAGATDASASPGSPSASPSPSTSPTSSPSAAEPASGRAAMARFLRGYYGTVPDDLDAGWSQLGPHEQAPGRASYADFWDDVDRVDVSGIRTDPASSSAEVTLTYHFSDGRVVVERQRLELVRSSDGGYLINNDDVLSSRTVRS